MTARRYLKSVLSMMGAVYVIGFAAIFREAQIADGRFHTGEWITAGTLSMLSFMFFVIAALVVENAARIAREDRGWGS